MSHRSYSRPSACLRLEPLEQRVTPATLTVSTLSDSGGGSFRQAVLDSNGTAEADQIVFAPGVAGTITLLSDLAPIAGSVSITGPGATLVNLRGNGSVSSILRVTDGNTATAQNVSISGLTISNGFTATQGGGIANTENLLLTNVFVTENRSLVSGGGISNSGGTLTIIGSTISSNAAQGSFEGVPFAEGGGISNNGDLILLNSTVFGNSLQRDAQGQRGGGGIAHLGGTALIANSTVVGNASVSRGGGISVIDGTLKLVSSIVARNSVTDPTASGPDIDGLFSVIDTSLIGIFNDFATSLQSANNVTGTPASPLDPLFLNNVPSFYTPAAALPTLVPRSDSPALGRGSNLFSQTVDQNGLPRNLRGGVDIGATQFFPSTAERFAVSPDQGAPSEVFVFDGDLIIQGSVKPYLPTFLGGARVATGDLTGDGIEDIITAAGPGGGPHIKVFDGLSFNEVASFFAFESTFQGGVSLAVADVSGDGRPDLIFAAGAGGGPRVRVVNGASLNAAIRLDGTLDPSAELASFFAFVPNFTGGVTISAADFTSDGRADIAVAAGPGGGPHIRIINGTRLNVVGSNGLILDQALIPGALSSFFFQNNPNFTGGVVLAAGRLDDDGVADLAVGIASNGPSVVQTFSGATQSGMGTFNFFDNGPNGGLRLALIDLDNTGTQETILAGQAPGATARLEATVSTTGADILGFTLFFGFAGGVWVG